MSLIWEKPERATWWAQQEADIDATFRSDRPSYAAMQKFNETQSSLFAMDETIGCFCGD